MVSALEDTSLAEDVFLSYCQENGAVAQRLKDALEANGVAVRVDFQHMRPGQSIRDFVVESIRSTSSTVWVVSQDSLLSDWVAIEISLTLKDALLWTKRSLIACYIDERWLENRFRLEATERIDTQLRELEILIAEYAEKGLDSIELNDQKTRLHELRFHLGELLRRLRDCLCIDIREANFAQGVQRLALAVGRCKNALGIEKAAPADFPARRKEIRDLIFAGEVVRALQCLMNLVYDFSDDDQDSIAVVIISANYRELTARPPAPGQLKEYRQERTAILGEALELLEKLTASAVAGLD